jgi:hypothetical protein
MMPMQERMCALEAPEVRLARVEYRTPGYAQEWRKLPLIIVQAYLNDIMVSSHLRTTLPAGERHDCQIVNVLFDIWRERGQEIMVAMYGTPLAMCALTLAARVFALFTASQCRSAGDQK